MKRKVEDAGCGRAFEQCSAELRSPAWLVTLGAFGVHAMLVGAALLVSSPSPSQASKTPARVLLDVELAPAPPPPAQPAPEPEQPKQEPIKAAPTRVKAPTPPPVVEPEKPAETPEPEPPAPAAAQAGQALTATEAAPNQPADTLATGDGAGYAGGTTERGGTSKQAVAATTARAYGVEGGTGTAAPDRSRPPQLASGLRWDCPTPEEALEEGVEHAKVGLMIEVDADGKVLSIEIKDDPGYGFAREAKSCAMRKRWVSGLDREGKPRRAKQLVNVNF